MDGYWSFVLYLALHAVVNGVAMYLIVSYMDLNRPSLNKALVAFATVAPALFLGIFALVFPSVLNLQEYVLVRPLAPVAVFLVLWLIVKLEPKRAGIFAAAYFVVTLLTPLFLRLIFPIVGYLFGSESQTQLGPTVLLLTIIIVPVIIWVAAKSLGSPKRATVFKSYGLAAVLAPSLIGGHGVGIAPAALVWPLIFKGGVDGLIMLIATSISVLVTGTIFLGIAKVVQRNRTGKEVETNS